jgi:transcriptional regulator with XRE-family HTH domain
VLEYKRRCQPSSFKNRLPTMFEINHQEIGNRIRERRQKMGFSQEMLAGLVGVHHSKISRLEAGKLEPRFDLISKISYYLQIRIDDLLEFGPLVRVAFTRRDLRPKIILEPYELHALALQKKENQLNPFYLIVTQTQATEDAGEVVGRDDIKIFQHPGEEFLFVEEGVIRVYFAEEVGSGFRLITDHPELFPMTLYPGDSLCFDSDIPHTYFSVLQPSEAALESVQISGAEIAELERLRKLHPDKPLKELLFTIKTGMPAHALVVCSSMVLKPEDLRRLKEHYYAPR